MEVEINNGSKQVPIRKVQEDVSIRMDDHVAIEEALLIQLKTRSGLQDLTITMRTPGEDEDLVVGLLFTEGLIDSSDQIESVVMVDPNCIQIEFVEDHQPNLSSTDRNFFSTSACGVCGKSSLDSIAEEPKHKLEPFSPSSSVLLKLYDQLASQQSLFSLTGGIHAAALFDEHGEFISMREDVGRHN
ncbi:MAG: sulfurtransferase FdhD, partial [Chitinophagales bacterium]|nr:sulfurtransferase FdhD [Chitinophagales bacterium]